MSFLWDKQCIYVYGKKCCVLGAVMVACILFIGVVLGYGLIAAYYQGAKDSYTTSELQKKGIVSDVVAAQEEHQTSSGKAGQIVSETKGFFANIVEISSSAIARVFGISTPADVKKSTLSMGIQ